MRKIRNDEYRHWSVNKSKLANLLDKGLKPDFSSINKALYLGAASGTTASHLSDILVNGEIYCIEFSEKSLKKFISRCKDRNNLYPILADARKPKEYSRFVDLVDFLYQDVTQKNQVSVFKKNASSYLKTGARAILIIKTKSIDVTMNPKEVLEREKSKLRGFKLLDQVNLKPYHKDHWALFLEYKG